MRFPLLARTWDFLVGRKTRRSPVVRLTALPLEDRITPTGRPLPLPFIFVGAGSGAPPLVRAYYAETGALAFEKQPFDAGFTGGVRVGTGDLDHDGVPDLIAAAGPGGGPRVVVYSGKTGNQLAGPLGSFHAYDPAFTGGVSVASGDVDGDGYHDLITAAGAGGTPHVKVFSGYSGELIASFQAFDTGFRGGATVMAADFTGDGKAELVVGAGTGGGPNVRVFDLNTGNPLPPPLGSFFAFDESFTGGVEVGTDVLTGDVTGDGRADIAVGRGAGAGSLVRVFDGKTGNQVREFSPFGAGMTAGVRVATAFIDNDKYADIVAATGAGVTAQVKVFSGLTGTELASPMSPYTPFGTAFTGGLFVAASNDPDQVLMYFSGGSAVSGGSLSMTADVWDGNQYNGLQQPTGTVTFTTTVNGTATTLGTVALVGYDTGKSRATLVVNPVTLPPGMYSAKAAYGGDSMFIPDFRNAQLQIQPAPPVTGDLDIIDSNGVEVVENLEENPGGWVAVNNDNDNYNFLGDAAAQAKSLLHKLDKDELAKVDGENDLVRISVHDLDSGNVLGKFSLEWSSTNIRVWKTADKDGQVLSGDNEVPVGKAVSYWVEGLALSSTMVAEQVKLKWSDMIAGIQDVDAVNFTVYQIDGVMNVPGYSVHKYQVLSPVVQYGFTPSVLSVTGGQKQSEFAGATSGSTVTTMQATILWDAGPVVGKYRVTPGTAVSNFFVDREVNVVKVAYETEQGAGNVIDYKGPPMQFSTVNDKGTGKSVSVEVWKIPLGVAERAVQSHDNWNGNGSIIAPGGDKRTGDSQAMLAKLNVVSIEGPVPVAGGSMRGVRFVEAGLIQNIRATAVAGVFPGFTPARRRVPNYVDGLYHVDIAIDQEAGNPYYHKGSAFYRQDEDPAAGAPVQNKAFKIYDNPLILVTDAMSLTISTVTKQVEAFELRLDFSVFASVRTLDTGLGADTVFTQRAKAAWYFDGSGKIDAQGKWEAAGVETKNDGDKLFGPVIDGSVVPVTKGVFFNVITVPGVVQWSTVGG